MYTDNTEYKYTLNLLRCSRAVELKFLLTLPLCCVLCLVSLSQVCISMCLGLLWAATPSRSWGGARRMVFPTGSVPTPGTLTGVITVSRDTYFTTFSIFLHTYNNGTSLFQMLTLLLTCMKRMEYYKPFSFMQSNTQTAASNDDIV